MHEREERVGRNEVLFREINERLKSVQEAFNVPADRADFVCECASAECTRQISMTLDEYASLRSDSAAFAVVPGHDVPDLEDVVRREPGYAVVRKRGLPGEIARQADPRA